MDNKSRKSRVSVGIGGTLIITVFMVLCLIIFAALSFTTAYSDLKFSNKSLEITQDYYHIHGEAEKKLAEISDVLKGIKDYQTDGIVDKLKSIDGISVSIDEIPDSMGGTSVSMDSIPVSMEDTLVSIDTNPVITDGTSVVNEQPANERIGILYDIQGELNQKINVSLNIFYDTKNELYYYSIVSWNLSNIELPNYEDEIIDLWESE